MSKERSSDRGAESNDGGIEFTFSVLEGAKITTTLNPNNTIIYQDQERPEISCVIHSFEDREKPLYLFGQRENMNHFIEFLLSKGFQSYETIDNQTLMQIGLEHLAWLGSGNAYSNEGPVHITGR